ncbi:MAG: NIPSNAP family protein [Bacteroidota bacterium]
MKRRDFVQSGLLASALPFLPTPQADARVPGDEGERELIEIREYEMRFRSNPNTLLSYLNQVLAPALKRICEARMFIFQDYGLSDPRKYWVIIAYPGAAAYLKGNMLDADEAYQKAAKTYAALPADQPLFSRFQSSLLLAFSGMPQIGTPEEGTGLFELRTYEGYNEDAVRRKIKMFNAEEIVLFNKVGLYPFFFGDMLIGPHRPALTYMLHFRDMAEREANWKAFLAHPDWNDMKARPEYANTVSHIRKQFLLPVSL